MLFFTKSIEFLFLFSESENYPYMKAGIMQMDDVLQYILSKNTIFIFYFTDIEGGLKLYATFLSFMRNMSDDLPISLFGL